MFTIRLSRVPRVALALMAVFGISADAHAQRRQTAPPPTAQRSAPAPAPRASTPSPRPRPVTSQPPIQQRLQAYKGWQQRTGIVGKPSAAQFRNFTRAHTGNARGGSYYARSGYRSSRSQPTSPWQRSEQAVTKALQSNRQRSTTTQKTFRNPSTSRAVRPDVYQTIGSKKYAFEVKRYDLSTGSRRNSLVSTVTRQAKERAQTLPSGTRQQIIIDVRGQTLSQATLRSIKDRIVKNSGGVLQPGQVSFLKRLRG